MNSIRLFLVFAFLLMIILPGCSTGEDILQDTPDGSGTREAEVVAEEDAAQEMEPESGQDEMFQEGDTVFETGSREIPTSYRVQEPDLPEETAEKQSGLELFRGMNDIKKAVIYSEILKRKYT